MTNWKLGNREAPFAENDLCDRWGQQGFWMWKQCPYCHAMVMRGKLTEGDSMSLISSPTPHNLVPDNTGRRAIVYAVNVSVALVPLEGRKQHFPEHVEDWEFGMKKAKNDYTEWLATPTHGRDGHRVACGGCGNLSVIEEWDVEPNDLWIPEDGEVIGFIHSDATTDSYNKSWGCYIYEAVARKADGKLTWRRDKDHNLSEERSQYHGPTEMADRLAHNNIRVTNRRVMNVSPGSNLRHGAKVRERKELTAELLRSF